MVVIVLSKDYDNNVEDEQLADGNHVRHAYRKEFFFSFL